MISMGQWHSETDSRVDVSCFIVADEMVSLWKCAGAGRKQRAATDEEHLRGIQVADTLRLLLTHTHTLSHCTVVQCLDSISIRDV